ncbi:MAG: EamA family transporter [Planctomycetota bacterium]
MNALAVLLVLSSCATHAAWNLMAKRSSRTTAFFWMGAVLCLLPLAPAFVLAGGIDVLRSAPPRLWLMLPVTGLSMCTYYGCLAAAYRHGDVSVAYPLVRTTPIFVLVLAGMILGQRPSALAVAGIVLVVAGCFVLPLERLGFGPGGFSLRAYANRTSFWALGAALGSTGYTLVDDLAMEALREAAPGVRGAFVYECLQYGLLAVGLLVVSLVTDGRRKLAEAARGEKLRALLVGALVFVTYMLILWAYANAEKVAYVAGLRQLSILLGVAGGMLFFGEKGGRPRLVAAAVIVAGLIMIGFAR